MENEPFCSIFLFINDSSGGGIGEKMLSQEVEKIEFHIALRTSAPLTFIHVYFFNLHTKSEKAFRTAKKLTEEGEKVIGIVCGGDGTIMWVVSQLNKYGINPMRIPLGVMPLGTGNDFSQHLGWGKEKSMVTENEFRHLKKLIKRWMVAKIEEFDIWDVKADVFDYGKFEKINKRGENQIIEGKSFSRSFCNYFSFGIDGKIGYSFDKHRTKSRVGNLMVYGTMGVLRAATKTKTVQQLVEKMEIRHQLGDEFIQGESSIPPPKHGIKQEVQHSLPISNLKEYGSQTKNQNMVVFTSKYSQPKEEISTNLSSDYYNLMALNINSFMGGVTDIWAKASDSEFGRARPKFHEPSSKDRQLEILCFSSSVGMALERVFGGFATKISQSGGPYYFKFREYRAEQKHRTYLQIDGEFIRISHPRSITITKSLLSPTSRIKVLRRNIEAEEMGW